MTPNKKVWVVGIMWAAGMDHVGRWDQISTFDIWLLKKEIDAFDLSNVEIRPHRIGCLIQPFQGRQVVRPLTRGSFPLRGTTPGWLISIPSG